MTREGLEQLKEDEGLRLKSYLCPAGFWTVGYGHNLEAYGMSKDKARSVTVSREEADALLIDDVREVEEELAHRIPNFSLYPPTVQDQLVNMAFNMGVNGLMGFKTFLRLIGAREYAAAGQSLKTTKYYRQVTNRANRLIESLSRTQ